MKNIIISIFNNQFFVTVRHIQHVVKLFDFSHSFKYENVYIFNLEDFFMRIETIINKINYVTLMNYEFINNVLVEILHRNSR